MRAKPRLYIEENNGEYTVVRIANKKEQAILVTFDKAEVLELIDYLVKKYNLRKKEIIRIQKNLRRIK
jgi:predicted nucleic acid-binding protein